MLRKTHVRISNEALRRLGITLSGEVYSKFKEGIVAPDQWKDYPHHYGKSEAIRNNLIHARQWYLQDNLQNAFFHLGVALHYIQDSYTSVISYDSPNNQMWHQNYEQNIEDSQFVYDVENALQYFFSNDYSQLNKYSALAKNLSVKIEGKAATLRVATLVGEYRSDKTGKPKVDLNMALKASLIVTESVLSSKDCPKLETTLSQVLIDHEGQLQRSEVELSNRIVELVRKRDSLRSRIVEAPGIKVKLRTVFLKVAAGIRNMQVNSKSREYDSQGHLRRVAKAYQGVCNSTTNHYVGWYNFKVPELRFDIVERELLSIQDVASKLGFDEGEFRKLLQDANCLSYRVRNKELLKRSESNRVLEANPIKDFTEFPK